MRSTSDCRLSTGQLIFTTTSFPLLSSAATTQVVRPTIPGWRNRIPGGIRLAINGELHAVEHPAPFLDEPCVIWVWK
ncbi:hypothetical protein CPB85DRAFT_1340622 [Mucidula mucida]|nr:hypothetical protein CPB85DRAFT_1340622 [Mucidula mucida]